VENSGFRVVPVGSKAGLWKVERGQVSIANDDSFVRLTKTGDKVSLTLTFGDSQNQLMQTNSIQSIEFELNWEKAVRVKMDGGIKTRELPFFDHETPMTKWAQMRYDVIASSGQSPTITVELLSDGTFDLRNNVKIVKPIKN